MLAKAVARQNAVPPQVEEYVKSACVAAHHACALLGVVTLAANSKEVTKVRLDGTTFVTQIRDSFTVSYPRTRKVENPSEHLEQEKLRETDLAVPDEHWADQWEKNQAELKLKGKRPAVKVRKAALKKKSTTAASVQSILATKECINSIVATAKADLSTPSAQQRLGSILARIREKGKAVTSTELREPGGLGSEAFER